MFNQPPKFDELFASIAESNKKWFENLTSATKAQNEGQDNQLLDTFTSFFDKLSTFIFRLIHILSTSYQHTN